MTDQKPLVVDTHTHSHTFLPRVLEFPNLVAACDRAEIDEQIRQRDLLFDRNEEIGPTTKRNDARLTKPRGGVFDRFGAVVKKRVRQ